MDSGVLVGIAGILTAVGAFYNTFRKSNKSDFDTVTDRLNGMVGRQVHELQANEILINELKTAREDLQRRGADLEVQLKETRLQNVELKKQNLHLEEEKSLLIKQHNGLMEYLRLHNVPMPIFDKKGNIIAEPLDKDKEVG